MFIEIIQTGIPILCLIALVVIMTKLKVIPKTYDHIFLSHNVKIEGEERVIQILKSDSMKIEILKSDLMKAQESIKSLSSKVNSMEKHMVKSMSILGEKIDEINSLDDEARAETFYAGRLYERSEEISLPSAVVKKKDK